MMNLKLYKNNNIATIYEKIKKKDLLLYYYYSLFKHL